MKQNVLLVVESSYKMDERTVSKDILFHKLGYWGVEVHMRWFLPFYF